MYTWQFWVRILFLSLLFGLAGFSLGRLTGRQKPSPVIAEMNNLDMRSSLLADLTREAQAESVVGQHRQAARLYLEIAGAAAAFSHAKDPSQKFGNLVHPMLSLAHTELALQDADLASHLKVIEKNLEFTGVSANTRRMLLPSHPASTIPSSAP